MTVRPKDPSARAMAARIMAACGLALLLAGCLPESVDPLSPPDQTTPAPELLGLWRASAEGSTLEDGTLYVHVFLGERGRLDFVTISHEADGSGDTERYHGHVTEVQGADGQGRRFINLQPVETAAAAPAPYTIIGYALDSEALTVRFLSPQILAAAIAAGELAGEVTEDSFGLNVRLTGPGAEIAAFLAAADAATLYGVTMDYPSGRQWTI